MIELIFTKGPMTGVRFALETDSITIGRLSECEIEINQPNISRRHAFIKRAGSELQIIDNNSGNGTFVNGRRVKRAELRNGDEVSIGSNTLRVDVKAQQLSETETRAAKVRSSDQKTRVESTTRFIVTDYTTSNPQPREFSSENLSIGRGNKCRVVLNDAEASRVHATIQHRQGSFTIKDSGSANGTRVNGERIIEQQLQHENRIRIGNTLLKTELSEGILRLNIFTETEANIATSIGPPRKADTDASSSTPVADMPTFQPERKNKVPVPATFKESGVLQAESATQERTPRSFGIVRVLVTVFVVAIFLLIIGKTYAAIR